MDEYLVRVGKRELNVRVTATGEVCVDGEEGPIAILRLSDQEFVVSNGARQHQLAALRLEKGYLLSLEGLTLEAKVETNRERLIREHAREGTAEQARAEIHAPMPAMVVRVEVVEGQSVKAGQGLLVLEAMKMENELRAPKDGVIKTVRARAGTAVEKGALLILLE